MGPRPRPLGGSLISVPAGSKTLNPPPPTGDSHPHWDSFEDAETSVLLEAGAPELEVSSDEESLLSSELLESESEEESEESVSEESESSEDESSAPASAFRFAASSFGSSCQVGHRMSGRGSVHQHVHASGSLVSTDTSSSLEGRCGSP